MKTIGLIGGMSWESTTTYYRLLNLGVNKKLGGLNSAKIILNSVNFAHMEEHMLCGDWQSIEDHLIDAAQSLERSGADFFLICTNTMHKLAPGITEKVNIPLLHIADATGEGLAEKKIGRVGLLGTAFTMEHEFYRKRLEDNFGISVSIPQAAQRKRVNDIIFEELCRGEIRESSKEHYIQTMKELSQDGAEAIILGCTEIGMLVKQKDVDIPLFDTTVIHADKAVDMALLAE